MSESASRSAFVDVTTIAPSRVVAIQQETWEEKVFLALYVLRLDGFVT